MEVRFPVFKMTIQENCMRGGLSMCALTIFFTSLSADCSVCAHKVEVTDLQVCVQTLKSSITVAVTCL